MFHSIMHFNYSNTLTKKLNSERILLKNSGVLKFCSAELWFSILMRYSAIWPLTHGKQEVGDADIGFWWWSDMQTAPSKMLLEIYTTNELSRDSEFFFLQIYSGTFQKVIAFCDRFIALVDRVKKSLLGTISLSKMHFIDVFHIFVNALLSEYSEIRMNAMYMKHWQGWGEYLTGWREVPLIILVHMTPPCLTTESIQSIFSM